MGSFRIEKTNVPRKGGIAGVWPLVSYPYREISGGRELFLILMAVDVILGPLMTLTIFNRAKPWPELRRDLAIVVLIQLAALVYLPMIGRKSFWTVLLDPASAEVLAFIPLDSF